MSDQPMSSAVDQVRRGSVMVVTLRRPNAANALDLPTARRLRSIVDDAAISDVGALVVRSEGPVFCAGGDLAAMNESPDASQYVDELAGIMHEVVLALVRAPFAVVAAVQGPAAGAGLSLVLASDHVVATNAATFLAAYSAVGLTPDCGMSYLLPLSIGRQRASDVVMGGRRLSASQAWELGMVASIAEERSLDDVAFEAARRLAGVGSASRAHSKRLLARGWIDGFAAHLDDERRTIAELAGTEASRDLRRKVLDRGRAPQPHRS